MKKLILGSASPSRIELLKKVNIKPYKIMDHGVDEVVLQNEKPLQFVNRIALEKCQNIIKQLESQDEEFIILTADTVACKGARILRKAETDADIEFMLKLLSGTNHYVYTSFCLMNSKTGQKCHKTVHTRLKFKRLSSQHIKEYIETKEGIGKAGGYNINGFADCFVDKIIGSNSNVIGLPLCPVFNAIKTFIY